MKIELSEIISESFADLNEPADPFQQTADEFDNIEPKVTQTSFEAAIDFTKIVAQLRKDGFRLLKDERKVLDRWPR